jgi:hypothetical protein
MTVTANAVNISEDGTYLVSFYASGVVTSGELSTSLYLNDTALADETIVQPDSSGAASKTILLNLDAGDTLSLYNTSTIVATLSGASLTVVKLA